MSKKILIIDDSAFTRKHIRDVLEKAGFDVIGEAINGESGIDKSLELNPDVITLDNILPDMTGFDVLDTLKQVNIPAPNHNDQCCWAGRNQDRSA